MPKAYDAVVDPVGASLTSRAPDGSLTAPEVGSFLLRRAKDVPVRYLLELPILHQVGRLEFEAAIVKAEKIDLIHSHFAWRDGFGGMLARAETGRPLARPRRAV